MLQETVELDSSQQVSLYLKKRIDKYDVPEQTKKIMLDWFMEVFKFGTLFQRDGSIDVVIGDK